MLGESEAVPIPGLEARSSDRPSTALEDAVRRTIAAHADHLSDVDAGKCAVALEICAITARKRAGNRLSTVSNDLRLLTEILDSLAPVEDTEANALLTRAMREWEEALAGESAEHPGA